ncbi:MAG: hypothetical protein V4685_02525 [Bacteroidota bacterium]
MKRNYSIFIILLLQILPGCISKNEQLKTGWWKQGDDGFHLDGDVLVLNDSNMRNDTIFIDNKPIAIILTVNSHEMKIASIASGETGIYIHK